MRQWFSADPPLAPLLNISHQLCEYWVPIFVLALLLYLIIKAYAQLPFLILSTPDVGNLQPGKHLTQIVFQPKAVKINRGVAGRASMWGGSNRLMGRSGKLCSCRPDPTWTKTITVRNIHWGVKISGRQLNILQLSFSIAMYCWKTLCQAT